MTQVRAAEGLAAGPERLLGRYLPIEVLKADGTVRVLLASGEGGRQVVLKVEDTSLGGRDHLLIAHEAAALRRISSEHIAPLLDYGWDDQGFTIATAYVDGVGLDRRWGTQVPPRQVVALAIALMHALRDAHQAGVIHRDIKPSNILTNPGPVIVTATLIDFGLARSDELESSLRDVPVGTAQFMAPEGSGLLAAEVDERSDLYSAGVVLYGCLAGHPPFAGDTLGEVLRQHVNERPPELRSLGVEVPRALAEVIDRLLAKDPRDRYQSAEGVLGDLEQIAASMDRGEAEPPVVVGLLDRRRSLADPAFVGRKREIASLQDELERARAGYGRVVLVEAGSGGGKTRLMNEFASRSAIGGARVFRGQGIDQGAQRPFEILRGVGVGLIIATDDDSERSRVFTDRVASVLERRLDAAAAAIPELSEIFDVNAIRDLPEEFGEMRALEALEALLTSLGSPEEPAVIVLDDGQWADDLTLKLLARWHAHRTQASRHVLIAVAFRSEEVGPAHLLRAIEDPMRLELEPLRAYEVRSLVESMAGPVPAEAARLVVDLAEGSPFMASAVLRGLVEAGALVHTDDGWTVVADKLDEAGASRRAAAFLAQRIALLAEPTRSLLSGGAVLGKSFDLSLAAELGGLDSGEAVERLAEARRRHLVWMRGGECAFVHDKVRETVLEELGDDARSELHARAAGLIDRRMPRRPFEIAYHLDAAGKSEEALPYALVAAEEARRSNALVAAQANYEIAERGSSPEGRSQQVDEATRLQILEGLGDVLMLRGSYDEAGRRFQAASTAASDDALSRARLTGKLGELAFKQGKVGEGTRALEAALRTLRHRTPRNYASMLLGVVWEVLIQTIHTFMPRAIRKKSQAKERSRDDMLSCELYDKLAYAYWFHRGPLHALWAQFRGLNLAERYPPTPQLAKSLSTHVAAMSIIVPFFFDRTVRVAERSLQMWRQLGDPWGEGQALSFYGVTLYSVGRYEACIEKMREAIRLLEQTGDRWEASTATWHIAYAQHRLGDRGAATDIARHIHRTGVEIGDAQARAISLSVWAKASSGDVPADLIRTDIERTSDDTHASAELANAETVRLLAAGRIDDAVVTVDEAIRELRRRRVMHGYVAPLFTWRTVARRLQIETADVYARQAHRDAAKAWRRAARTLSIVVRVYPNERAQGWREIGLELASRGRIARARRAMERSLVAAERYRSQRERSATLAARAHLARSIGYTGADADIAAAGYIGNEATDIVRATENVTPSLVDRFESLLEQGRLIASALTKEAVWDGVRNAAMTLLRAERCVVCELKTDESGEPTLVPVAGSGSGEFGTSVAWEAVRAGTPLTISEEDAVGAVSESLVLAGVRSSLAAPILVRGHVAACFYVDHTAIGGLFASDEERIAGFIAAIAGAAVENAEGFAEVQELTRTLEKRVAERTTELADANDRLEHSLVDVKRLDQLKTEFMAMAAHDLRTPITVIGGFASTLLNAWTSFSEEQRFDFLDRIHSNTKRLSEFVENLLHFARIESGELSYHLQPFDVADLAARTAAEQGGPAGRVLVHRADFLPFALGDEQRTWQVITNLISNGLKFSPPDEKIMVDVRSRASENGGEIEVTVRDRGAGITLADQTKLFRKFTRIPNADGAKGPLGTGLGLYICKSIVEAQGGRLWVLSAPGEGSTFGFTLPVAGPAPMPPGFEAPTRG